MPQPASPTIVPIPRPSLRQAVKAVGWRLSDLRNRARFEGREDLADACEYALDALEDVFDELPG